MEAPLDWALTFRRLRQTAWVMGIQQGTLLGWMDSQARSVGVLLHPTSLPGDLGIGQFGAEARRFVDFLEAAGMGLWQVCPLGPTGYGDSPYQCFSAFAGNPYMIDLHPLVDLGLLDGGDLVPLQALPRDRVDFGGLYERIWPVLHRAAARFAEAPGDLPGYGPYGEFCETQAYWLDSYAAFAAAKAHFGGKPWYSWPKRYRSHELFVKSELVSKLGAEIEAVKFLQYLFLGQWNALRAYAAAKGISVVGDAPIFVAADSADVWASPEHFQLKSDGTPQAVAGVPPDYFSPTGQLWGNPLYEWKHHAATGFAWWIERIKANMALFDLVRLDHFRGFAAYWAIPAEAPDARPGKWVKAPGEALFRALADALPDACLIAEDLGEITQDVIALKQASGLPGMAVIQFGFGGDSGNIHLPHNHEPVQVVYPGTHDNDTTLGWYRSVDDKTRDHFRRYLGVDGGAANWDLIRAAYRSPARLAVVTMQDLLNLGSGGRMNTPGQATGNWQWRYSTEALNKLWSDSAAYLREEAELYGRLPVEAAEGSK